MPTNLPALEADEDQPLAYPTASATRVLGMGKTKLFAEISAGRLHAKRSGGKIVILREEAIRYLRSLEDVKPSDVATSGEARSG